MGKALVIKNVDFGTNKLTTVTLSDPIPCTGISLNKSAVSFTEAGATDRLTATVTPANTTDAVIWTTSDSNVVSVADGLVTATGCGTATITATCGNQTATCICTVSVALTFAYKLGRFSDIPNNRQYVRVNGTDAHFATAHSAETLTGKKKVVDQVSYQNMWAIPLPAGASKVNFTEIPATHRVTVFFVDNDTASPASGMSEYASMISGDANSYDETVALGNREVSIPSGANAIVFTLQYPGSGSEVTDATMQAISVVAS